MNFLNEQIDRWIFREYAPVTRSLPLYRIVYALLLLIFILPDNSAVAGLPDSFYAPPAGPAMLFHSFPPLWYFWSLEYLLELAAVCLLFGYRTRTASLAIVVLSVSGNMFRYSVGKIDHDVLLIAVPFCLAWSDWGARHSADARKTPSGQGSAAWPLALLVFMIALCMFTAAVSKGKSGWLDPHLEACRGQMLLNYVGAKRPTPLADAMLSVTSPFFWKSVDFSTVLVESSFIIAMFRLPAVRVVAAVTSLFHASIFFSMNIFFACNLIAYLCLLDFRLLLRYRWARALLRGFDRVAARVSFVPLALIVALFMAAYFYGGERQWGYDHNLLTVASVVNVIVGVGSLLWLGAYYAGLIHRASPRRLAAAPAR